MNKVKHTLLATIVGVCLAFSCFSLAACSSANDEETIREQISSELDVIKNLDTDAMISMLEDQDDTVAALEQMGIAPEDFLANFFDGFDYEISEVTIEDDSATASLILTCKSESDFEAAFEQAVSDDLESIASMSEDEAMKFVGATAMDTLTNLEPKQSEPISITFTKVDGNWVEGADTTLKVMNAMLAM